MHDTCGAYTSVRPRAPHLPSATSWRAAAASMSAAMAAGAHVNGTEGRAALHTGLDFPAEIGTPIHAAAGGIVVTKEWHAAYGNVLEIDHGNGLVTRYAHCSSIEVALGALVKRGQLVEGRQAQVVEKLPGGREKRGPARCFAVPNHLDPAAILQLLEDEAVDSDATDVLHVATGDGLAVGDDGQGLQCGASVLGRFLGMESV